MKKPFDDVPTLDEIRNINITMSLSVHEWRILAICAIKGPKCLIHSDDRKLARDLSRKIAEQTGKHPKT